MSWNCTDIICAEDVSFFRYQFVCRKKAEFPSDLKKPEMFYMHLYVSFFSSLTFWWVNWLLNLGYKKHLELDDLGIPPKQHEAKFNHERFRKAFREETVSHLRWGKKQFESCLSLFYKQWVKRSQGVNLVLSTLRPKCC